MPFSLPRPGAAAGTAASPPGSPRRDALLLAAVFAGWRLALTLVTFVGSRVFPLADNGGPGSVGPGREFDYWTSWAQWDGGWYLLIAREGYVPVLGEEEARSTAFFPLYPLLTRALSWALAGDEVLAGLVISHVAFLAFLLFFFQLVLRQYDRRLAWTSTLTVLCFPTAYFGVAMYTEALFLLLATMSLLSLQRNSIVLASASAGLAAATRLIGAVTWLPLALHSFLDWRWSWSRLAQVALAALLALLPVSLYAAYLQHEFGDPLYFLHVETLWQREPANPLSAVLEHLDPPPGREFQNYLDLAMALLFVGLLTAGLRRLPFAWWLYSAVAVLIPLSSGNLMSMPRYVLAALGVFVIAASYLQARPRLAVAVWSASLVLQGALAVMFINGHWTA